MKSSGKTIKQCLCALLCAAMSLSVMACSGGKVTSQKENGDAVIRVAHSADKILQDVNYEDSELLSEFSLNCFRNEYESGQLILTAVNDIDEYAISVGTFTNGTSELPQDCFEVYHEYYHEVSTIFDAESTRTPGMYPDALIPMETAVQHEMNSVKKGNNQGIWIAVKIPEKQETGTYQGAFELTINGEKTAVPATITVVDYTLPSKVSLKSCIPVQPGYLFNGELDDTQEMYEKHLDLLNEFRLAGQYLSSYVPVGDYDAYDTAVFDANLAVKYNAKDNCSAYAIRVIEAPSSEYGTQLSTVRFIEYLKAYIDVSIKNNVNLFTKAYVYMGNICDEPTLGGREGVAENAAKQFQDCLLQAAKYLEGKKCDATLKENIRKDLLSLSNVVTGEISEKMPTVNTYCPTADHFGSEAAEVNYKELRDIGKDYWFYTCTVPKIPYPTHHIDDNAVSSRVIGWMAKDYDLTGYLNWEMVYYLDYGTTTEEVYGQDLYDNVLRWPDSYGEGFYVYPGKVLGLDEPIKSLRLYTICDGMEDYEALLDLENSYKAIGKKAGVSGLSSDNVLDVIYETMYSNTRVYATSGEVEHAKAALTQLLLLAKQQKIAIENISVEGDCLQLSIVAPTDAELSVGGNNLTAAEKLGKYSRYATTVELTKTVTDNFEIKGRDLSAKLNLGKQINLLDDFDDKSSLNVPKDKASVLSEKRGDDKVQTVNAKKKDALNVVYNLEKNAITKKTESMNLVIYNNGNSRERLTVYMNGQVVLDTVYLEPGKNVYHFSRMQNLNWTTIKTANTIVFQFEESTSAKRSFSFDSLSVFADKN